MISGLVPHQGENDMICHCEPHQRHWRETESMSDRMSLEYDWMLIRTEARRGWEALYDRPWPEVQEAVREGWRRALTRA